MSAPTTLLELAGADPEPASLDQATLLFIDFQNEYLDGPIAVVGAHAAVSNAARLLAHARRRGTPIVHVAHQGRPGGLFDRSHRRGALIREVMPVDGEPVIEKGLPNAFAGTGLDGVLRRTGRHGLIVAGFMTHMCVSSTVRAALDLGYRATIDATSCGTRDLPDGAGGSIAADTVHIVSLAALADRFATIVRSQEDLIEIA